MEEGEKDVGNLKDVLTLVRATRISAAKLKMGGVGSAQMGSGLLKITWGCR
jgi:hypothetical protein